MFEKKDDNIFLNKCFWAQKVIERKFLINKNGDISPQKIHETYKEQVDEKVKKVLLILESPHKKEFNEKFEPIAPAQGATGVNINNKIKCLLQQIEKCQNTGCNGKENLQDDNFYLITIYNPVPYLASLGSFIAGKINNKIKRTVWRYAWSNKRCSLDFTEYLKDQEYDIVINACTKDLKPYVSCAIHNAEKIKTEYSVYHPSSGINWNKCNFGLDIIFHSHK